MSVVPISAVKRQHAMPECQAALRHISGGRVGSGRYSTCMYELDEAQRCYEMGLECT